MERLDPRFAQEAGDRVTDLVERDDTDALRYGNAFESEQKRRDCEVKAVDVKYSGQDTLERLEVVG